MHMVHRPRGITSKYSISWNATLGDIAHFMHLPALGNGHDMQLVAQQSQPERLTTFLQRQASCAPPGHCASNKPFAEQGKHHFLQTRAHLALDFHTSCALPRFVGEQLLGRLGNVDATGHACSHAGLAHQRLDAWQQGQQLLSNNWKHAWQ
eukprot:1159890-Pelagomonas_calceolata.AAC.2